uniref:Uncharacterized protein n=1 Tax=Plectus sambesii TaxID=2011161 RepID=A0A914VMZ5_9BILA
MFKCISLSLIALLWNLPAIFADPISSILGGLLGGSGGALPGIGAGAGAGGIGGAASGLGSAAGAVGPVASNAESFFGFAQNGLSLIGQGVQIANDIAQSPWFPPLLNSALDYQKKAQQDLYANNPVLGAHEPLDLRPKSTDSDSHGKLTGSAESTDVEGFSGVNPSIDSTDPFKLLSHGSSAFRVPKFTSSELLSPAGTVGKGATDNAEFSDVATSDPLAPAPAIHPDPYSIFYGAADRYSNVSTPTPTDPPNEADYFDSIDISTPKSTDQPDESEYLDSFIIEEPEGWSSASEKESETNSPLAANTPDPTSLLGGSASAYPPLLPNQPIGTVPDQPHPLPTGLPGLQQMFLGVSPHNTPLTKEDSQNPLVSNLEYTPNQPEAAGDVFDEYSGGTLGNFTNIYDYDDRLTETKEAPEPNFTPPTPTDSIAYEESTSTPTAEPLANSTRTQENINPSATQPPTPESGFLITDQAPNSSGLAGEAAVDDPLSSAVLTGSNDAEPPPVAEVPLRRVVILPRHRLIRLNSVQTKPPMLTKIVDTDFRQ